MTLRIHSEPETGTAKLLKAAIHRSAEDLRLSACDHMRASLTATTHGECVRELKAARDDINGALVAMGEK